MRVVAAVMILLAAGAGEAGAASSTPAVSPEDAHAGCLHTNLRPCMISLGSALWFDMKVVAPEIAQRNELDVNGKTARRTIPITAAVPGHNERITIALTLASPAPNDQVVKIEVLLPEDPELAHTAAEYDKTFLYDTVSVLLGKACPRLDKTTLYRFYENSLKPRETIKTEALKNGTVNRTKQTVDTDKVPFCGALFSLHRQAEWNGTPEIRDSARHKSAGSLTTLEIE